MDGAVTEKSSPKPNRLKIHCRVASADLYSSELFCMIRRKAKISNSLAMDDDDCFVCFFFNFKYYYYYVDR